MFLMKEIQEAMGLVERSDIHPTKKAIDLGGFVELEISAMTR